MFGHRVFPVHFLDLGFRHAAIAHHLAEVREVVDRDGAVDPFLHFVGQAFIGGIHIGEERVTADFGHFEGAQNRTKRGAEAPGYIAVPDILAPLAVAVMRDCQHFRVTGLLRRKGMRLQFAECAGEGKVLFRRDVLIAEENHLPVEKRLPERGEQLDFMERPEFDLSVFIDDSVYETRLAEWSAALAETLA